MMNIAADSPKAQLSVSESDFETETHPASLVTDDKVCLIKVEQMPYLPDQQVELLHLQAEADALLLQLQAIQQKRHFTKAKAAGRK